MAIKYTNIFHRNTLQNFTQIGIFGLKTNHLATQIRTQKAEKIEDKLSTGQRI
jgi:hypothetical protein